MSKNTFLAYDQPSTNMKNASGLSIEKPHPSEFDFLTARIGDA
jgi:hypothetical protein